MKEIERKFLIKEFPKGLELVADFISYQSYISLVPEIRIREKRFPSFSTYFLTFKSEGTLVRNEFEMELTEFQFEELADMVNHFFVRKEFKCFKLPTGDILECSKVDDNQLFYAEVEFETEEAANAFIPPSFLGEEVTYDARYRMKNYFKWRKDNV